MIATYYFSDTRRQKRSLAGLNEHFGNEVSPHAIPTIREGSQSDDIVSLFGNSEFTSYYRNAAFHNMNEKIGLAIIEDEKVILNSLSTFFDGTDNFSVQFTARKVEDLIHANPIDHAIELVLLDINLLGMSGIQGIPKIRELYPDVEIVMLTTFDQNEYIFDALKAGASGYLIKDTPIWEIKKALETIIAGGSFMSPSIARKVMESFNPQIRLVKFESLSPRQNEILNALVDGLSYKMIANKFGISGHTTNDHIKAIYRKLQVNSKGEAISLALRK